MIKIPIINSKLFALIDDEDYDKVKNYPWYLHGSHGNIYVRHVSKLYGRFYMHKLIANFELKIGETIDHKDRNGLNNQQYNLRPASQGLQEFNKNNKNPFNTFGIWPTKSGKFYVQVCNNSIIETLGTFNSIEEARKRRNIKLVELYGKFDA